MPTFKDEGELLLLIGALFDRCKGDPAIAPKIRDSGLVIRFRYEDPDAVVTINAAAPPTQPDAYFDVIWNDLSLAPDIDMSMKADISHLFWHGKINLMMALARRQIIAKGPVPKILKLLPAVEPMYAIYPQMLREMGREDLIVA